MPAPAAVRHAASWLGACLALLLAAGCAAPAPAPPPWHFDPAPADSAAPAAVRVADGLALTPWARLPGSPVTVRFDDRGRAFVTQTARRRTSDLDVRAHPDWMTADLGFETVTDQLRFYQRVLDPARSDSNAWLDDHNGDGVRDWRDLAAVSERVLRVEDTDADGRADEARLYADDLRSVVGGVAGSVVAHEGAVFVTAEPDVVRFEDRDDDGWAEARRVVATGFGVHIGFGGHGMSALTVGPDGRVYWAIGDLGASVVAPDGRRWHEPHSGAVFRANPDGSDFEIFAYGLRNTHEIAFDDHGNLIAVDNDGDHAGEDERVVYITDGSDTGWRTYWQYGKYDDPDSNPYKVWMDEGLHRTAFEGRPMHALPPVAPGWTGPAGFAYNPGAALGPSWRGLFFTTLFTGDPASSRVLAFRLEPDGAGFRLAETRPVLDGITATGLGFGPDGALYLADWIGGWDVRDEGRIWRLAGADGLTAAQRDTQRLLAEDHDALPDSALARRLAHADQRVRLKAQFALARRGALAPLAAALGADAPLARLHGAWGLGQLARRGAPDAAGRLVAALDHADAEVRAQAARALGDAAHAPAAAPLRALLADPAPRVRFFAAQALGRLADPAAHDPIVALVDRTGASDPTLAHAAAVALARIGDAGGLARLTAHPSRAVRLAAVVALRRLGDPAVAAFLADEDAWVVAEAARAIHDDAGIDAALPALAALTERPALRDEATLRRALNANLRLVDPMAAGRLAAFARHADAPAALRAEALAALAAWPHPAPLDRVEGRHRTFQARPAGPARDALAEAWEGLAAAETPVRVAAIRAAGRLGLASSAPALTATAADAGAPVPVRTAALTALADLDAPGLPDALRAALAADADAVRAAARAVLARADLPPSERVALLARALETGAPAEQRSALAALGALPDTAAHAVVARWMDRLEAEDVVPELHHDVLAAALATERPALHRRVEAYRRPGPDPVRAYREALAGGDAAAGRRLFFENATAQCVRCHAIGGEGGAVGPDLAGVGGRLGPRALLAALVAPDAALALGYGTVSLTLTDGTTVAGTLVDTTAAAFVVEAAGARRTVARTDVAARTAGPSAMPSMAGLLDRGQLRDLVAFLGALE